MAGFFMPPCHGIYSHFKGNCCHATVFWMDGITNEEIVEPCGFAELSCH